uniref:C2H2-type domain-containing protein n=1 Tax=Strongyloides stercoralis TaxID=6248 RepID=A0A0K0EQP7_STRER
MLSVLRQEKEILRTDKEKYNTHLLLTMNVSLNLKSDLNNLPTSNSINNSSSILPRLLISLKNNNFLKKENNGTSINISSFFNTKESDKVNHIDKEINFYNIWDKASLQIPLQNLNGFSLEKSYLDTGVNGVTFNNLICTECGVAKKTTEDLEIHIKTEHLNWYPFECPFCDIKRASDNQMREHLYSSHKKKSNEVKIFYNDNSEAKRVLQLMLDKSFYHFIEKNNSNSNSISLLDELKYSFNNSNKLKFQEENINNGKINNNTLSNNNIYMDNLATKINEILNSNNSKVINNYMLSKINNNNLKFNDTISQLVKNTNNNGNIPSTSLETSLPNFSNQLLLNNLFPTNFTPPSTEYLFEGKEEENTKKQKMLKKRVLGLCKRCKKPITAGSRQIHIFYHMAKEYSQYRFRCKHKGCTIAHYRKDQLESHHLKVHGEINVDMIEDRSSELQDACQELSMQLLGTCNNNPGPSAYEAQIIYDKQQEESANRIQKKRQRLMEDNSLTDMTSQKLNENFSNSLQDMLECNLCQKKILSRIKGFHVLWHLGKEKGIPRYACKLCDFKHDRAVNVHRHTWMVHEASNACEDMIVKHSDDMRAMSEACFGIVTISLNNNTTNDKSQKVIPLSNLSGEMLLEMLKKEKEDTPTSNEQHSLCNEKKNIFNENDECEENGSINSLLSE